jgi:sulfide:quinone oxidoreductase
MTDAMAHRIVILGGGTGGTLVANRLQRLYGGEASITVIDRDDTHVYQPGLLFVPFGLAEPSEIVRPRHAQLRDGIDFRLAEVQSVELTRNTVHLADAQDVPYDVLVIATGASLQPEETEGLTGPEWGDSIHTFYSLQGASALRRALEDFEGGRLVVNVIDMPIKCPVAPLEFCFLADWQLRQRGLRGGVELTFVTPLDGAFTKPFASARLGALLSEKNIQVESEFATGRVDASERRLCSWDEREVPFDLLVAIPVHGGPEYVTRSPGLGDALGFVPTDRHTLRSRAAQNAFVIGDAADVPTSKAGSVTHFEGETVVENIQRFLAGDELTGSYDGHANCFVETGFHKALLIDFDYEAEPLPGRFPEPHLGPLPLLAESRLNHIAKLVFSRSTGTCCCRGMISRASARSFTPSPGRCRHRGRELHDDRRDACRLQRRGRRRGVPRTRGAVERADGAGDRRRQWHRASDRPPLAGRELHAQGLSGERLGPFHPHSGQGLRSPDQGAL